MMKRGRKPSLIWQMSDAGLNALYAAFDEKWAAVARACGVTKQLLKRRTAAGRKAGVFTSRRHGGPPGVARKYIPLLCDSGKAGEGVGGCAIWVKRSAAPGRKICNACALAEGLRVKKMRAGSEWAKKIGLGNRGKTRTLDARRKISVSKRSSAWDFSLEELWERKKQCGGNWEQVGASLPTPCSRNAMYRRLKGKTRVEAI